jgi:hypothetical protein
MLERSGIIEGLYPTASGKPGKNEQVIRKYYWFVDITANSLMV